MHFSLLSKKFLLLPNSAPNLHSVPRWNNSRYNLSLYISRWRHLSRCFYPQNPEVICQELWVNPERVHLSKLGWRETPLRLVKPIWHHPLFKLCVNLILYLILNMGVFLKLFFQNTRKSCIWFYCMLIFFPSKQSYKVDTIIAQFYNSRNYISESLS